MTFYQHLATTVLLFLSISVFAEDKGLYDINLIDVDSKPVSLSEYKGKIVLLNFWATWCPPCVKEMPSMQRLKNHFADKPFEIVAINIGESSTAVSSFLFELDTELTFPILLDEEGMSYQAFGIRGLPMTLLLDEEGGLILRTLGGKDWDSEAAIQLIDEALNSKKSS
jgi:thiol-disulfide isomerase/thioredoxin